MRSSLAVLAGSFILATTVAALGAEKLTSLDNRSVKYRPAPKHYAVLERGGVRAVIVNNQAVDDDVLPGHRSGYSGVASLTHKSQPRNAFVPSYAGLNFEHIHDGTKRDRKILFEPRNAPMELRLIDKHTVELYQAPTPTWALESCHRYRLLEDGTIELSFECIPRRRTYRHGYIGLFWASYINQPESLDIHFRGRSSSDRSAETKWIRGVTPKHGVRSTHVGGKDERIFQHADDFPLSLVFNRSRHRYTRPWYFGVNHKMAVVYMFRPQDKIRLTQSPSGGGKGNPAWDFQTLIDNYQTGQRYQFVMRLMYIPFQSREQTERRSQAHLRALSE